jgi:hypothetical protein
MRVIWEEELHYTKQNVILQLPYCFILGLFMLFRKCFIHVCNPIDVIIPTMQLSYDVFQCYKNDVIHSIEVRIAL